MRKQDELLAIYPSADPFARKFILVETEGLSLTFDSDELLEFLHKERGHPDPLIREQALHTLLSFLPGFIRKRYNLSDQFTGVWTDRTHRLTDDGGIHEATSDRQKARTERREAGLFSVRHLANALLGLARSSKGAIKAEAQLALAQFPLRTVNSELWVDLFKEPASFESLLACAFSTVGEEGEERLAKAVREAASHTSSVLLLLTRAPSAHGFDVLMDLAPRTDTIGRVNLAIALAKMEGVDHVGAVKRLTSPQEAWVTVYCLRALEATRNPAYLELIRRIFETSTSPSLKRQAVRAAGGIHGPEALEFCLWTFDSAEDEVKAQALESLVRLRCPHDTLQRVGRPLLLSPVLRTRVNAILACVEPVEGHLSPEIEGLTLSDDTVERAEAAYCLGYLQNTQSLETLSILAEEDPSLHVRIQAIKSLSRYPAEVSSDTLLRQLKSHESRTAVTAARVLSRYASKEATFVCERLMGALETATGSPERARIYRTLGVMAGKIKFEAAIPVLMQGLDANDRAVLRGAVEGWIRLGGLGPEDVTEPLKKIATSGDPGMVPRALLALFTRGDPEVLDQLGLLLASPDEQIVRPALETAIEIALLVSAGDFTGRFPGLEARLTEIRSSVPFRVFQSLHDVVEHRLARGQITHPSEEKIRTEGSFVVRRSQRNRTLQDGVFAPPPREVAAPASANDDRKSRDTELPKPARTKEFVSSVSGFARLRKHLTAPRLAVAAEAHRFSSRLGTVSQLVPGDLSVRTVWQKVSQNLGLVVPVVAAFIGCIVIGLAIMSRIDSGPAELQSALLVKKSVGRVTEKLDRFSGPLVSGQTVEAGTRVSTGERSSVVLATRNANSLTLEAGSNFTLDEIKGKALDLVVSVTKGHYAFDWRKAGKITVNYSRHALTADHADFALMESEGKFSLIVKSGSVVVDERGGRTTTVRSGSVKPLE